MKLSKLLKSIGCVAVLAFSASQANAAYIVASADTNLNYGSIAGLNTFYSNMFSGNDVFATAGWSVGNTQSYMAANSGTFTTGAVSAAALAGKEWFVASTNNVYSAGELSDIVNFVTGGGNLFVLGEQHVSYDSMNAVANSILSAVGSSMTIGAPQSAGGNWSATGANIGAHALTSGITSFGGSYASTVTGGTMLFTADSTNQVVIAIEGAASQVPEPTTLALLGLGLLGFAVSRRSKQ